MPVDVHPAARPIHSLKEFVVHLFTITCGILIALGLENVVEGLHHRRAAREARAAVVRELSANHAGLSKWLELVKGTDGELRAILGAVRRLETDRSAWHEVPELDVHINTPSSTAWSTATATGALAFMDRADVELFSAVYEHQQLFVTAQQRATDAMLELESFAALTSSPLARGSDARVLDAERAAGRALAATATAADVGRKLDDRYREVLVAQ